MTNIDTDEENGAQRTAIELVPLLKEYSEKLRLMVNEIAELQKPGSPDNLSQRQAEMGFIRDRFLRLRPAANQLACAASQYVQHGKLTQPRTSSLP